jgi:hypothetical protein
MENDNNDDDHSQLWAEGPAEPEKDDQQDEGWYRGVF